MPQSSLLKPHLVLAKGVDQHRDWTSPPRKDPEQKFRRLGSKHSGGNYTYRERHSWWSGERNHRLLPPFQTCNKDEATRITFQTPKDRQRASAEAPRIRVRDREERVNNLWGELAALNERLAGGDPVFARKRIDYLR